MKFWTGVESAEAKSGEEEKVSKPNGENELEEDKLGKRKWNFFEFLICVDMRRALLSLISSLPLYILYNNL